MRNNPWIITLTVFLVLQLSFAMKSGELSVREYTGFSFPAYHPFAILAEVEGSVDVSLRYGEDRRKRPKEVRVTHDDLHSRSASVDKRLVLRGVDALLREVRDFFAASKRSLAFRGEYSRQVKVIFRLDDALAPMSRTHKVLFDAYHVKTMIIAAPAHRSPPEGTGKTRSR